MTMLRKYRRKNTKCGEAGFTLVELIIVIVLTSLLGVFGFQMLAQSLLAQRNMQLRKEHSDDAVMALDKISRELRQASLVHISDPNELGFVKYAMKYTLADTDTFVLYKRDAGTNQLLRSETPSTGVSADDYDTTDLMAGSLVAEGVTEFTPSVAGDLGLIKLRFEGEDEIGVERQTSVRIRNVVP